MHCVTRPFLGIECSMLYRVSAGKCDFRVSLGQVENELLDGGFDEDFDLLVLSYNAFDEIDLESEIAAESDCLTGLAALSGNKEATVFCVIVTSIMGIKHISVAVCHKGKLVDIVDRTSNIEGDEFATSQKIKIYSTDCARIGVLVDKDALIERNWEKITPHCDLVLAVINDGGRKITGAANLISSKFSVPSVIVANNSVEWKTV